MSLEAEEKELEKTLVKTDGPRIKTRHHRNALPVYGVRETKELVERKRLLYDYSEL
jgi:hypothetical protein